MKNYLCTLPAIALCVSSAQADVFDFSGQLTVYLDPTFIEYTSFTGQINFDSATGQGTANFDPVVFLGTNLTIRDVALTQTGSQIHADGFWDWGANIDQPLEWDWDIASVIKFGPTTFSLLDTDGDGLPGTALTTGPFPAGTTFAIEGTATPAPVPMPAAFWLFGSGLLGLLGVAKRRVPVSS